ncbi:copper amine oxidase N-terminal domain-containing protein [Gudongella sp. DL1XJH-153]|uniref:copper amine oxidase N-terminal domain-containing protein n=1 Tax=Gudongella sp. DL1XJH-153 TaxID=3409804 RepID=UPI003BB77CFA
MNKQIISIFISFIMVLTMNVSPVLGATDDWWTEEKAEIIREAEMEMENYREKMNIGVSDGFQENLRNTKSLLEDETRQSWLSVQELLANFLNANLEASEAEMVFQLVSYAQDYNSSRSNKYSSRSAEDDIDNDADEYQTKAQDYNSSRSNKPSTAVYIGDNDPDSDDDGLLDAAERLEIRIPIETSNITLLENLEIEEMNFTLGNRNADVVLAMIFADSIQEQFKSSETLNSCELNDKGLAFYFQDDDSSTKQYLKDEFFIPLGIGGDLDCDDDGLDDVVPGVANPDDNNGGNRIIIKIGNEDVITGNVRKVLEVPPFIQNNRTMVPFRFIGEELGAEIDWNGEERKVEYKLGDNILELWIGNNTARINGEEVMLDDDPSIRPFIINSRTVVPVRFISETLGFEVAWNNETQEITIENGNPLYEGETQEGSNPLFED